MKKEAIFLFLVFGILVFLNNVEQVSAKYGCSNDTEIDYEIKEIAVGDIKTINGLPIGVCNADESAVVNRIAAELIIDSAEISLLNSSAFDVVLLSGSYSVTLVNSESESATIKVSDSSLEIDKNTCEKIGSLEVMLVNTGEADGNKTADIVVGVKKLSLSNKEKESEVVEIGGIKYLIELFSASDTEASPRVGKCEGGDFVQIAEEDNETNDTDVTEQNVTTNETDFDFNETINETITDNNLSAEMNETSEVKKEIGESCFLGEECLTGFCDDGICEKKGFFDRIVEWFRGLFG